MATLLDTLAPEQTQQSFGEELRASMTAVRLTFRWFGTRRSVTTSQKHQAAETFDAESKFVSMGKKLFDTRHPAWKSLSAVRSKIQTEWRNSTLPYPEPGIRLLRRHNTETFTDSLADLRSELRDAEQELARCYDELRVAARKRLGSLYDPGDYPTSMHDQFDIEWDFPNVEPPEYLRLISPNLYRQETDRVRNRFEEAVSLAEDAFFTELAKLVEHLTDRLSGNDDGKPKIFRDTVVTNLLEFFDKFKQLNIGSNNDLDRMVSDVRRIVGGVTPDGLRSDVSLRNRVATELTRVQASLDGLMVDRPRRNLIRPRAGVGGTLREK